MDKSKSFTRKEIVNMLYDPELSEESFKEELEDEVKKENLGEENELSKSKQS